MKTILLIRHGKSSWSDPEADDFDRVLNMRGKLSTTMMAAWLEEHDYRPDFALVSAAVRTRETWERMATVLSCQTEVTVEKALYLAAPNVMLDELRDVSDKFSTVALVGHQPGLSSLARKLADTESGARFHRLFTSFPTASVTVLKFCGERWQDLDYGACQIAQFGRPKDQV